MADTGKGSVSEQKAKAHGSMRARPYPGGTDPTTWQAYGVCAPPACDRAMLAMVAGTRGHIESAFAMAQQEGSLDDNEVRRVVGWSAT